MDFHTNTCCFVTSIKTRDSDNITCLKASFILVLDRHVGISAGIIVATEVNTWYRSSIYILCSFCNSDILFLATDGLPVVDNIFGWGNWSLLFLYLNGKCSRSLFILVCICRLDGGNDVCFTFTNNGYLTILYLCYCIILRGVSYGIVACCQSGLACLDSQGRNILHSITYCSRYCCRREGCSKSNLCVGTGDGDGLNVS